MLRFHCSLLAWQVNEGDGEVDAPLEAYRYRVAGEGTSVHRRCKCDVGWGGDACAERSCGRGCDEAEMAGRGQCVNGTCFCRPGWVGSACERPACYGGCGEDASPPRGECLPLVPPSTAQLLAKAVMHVARAANGLDNQTHASAAYAPVREWREVGSAKAAEPPPLARCVCRDGWFGPRCDQPRCPRPPTPPRVPLPFTPAVVGIRLSDAERALECGGHGECHGGICVCHPGYTGSACEQPACPYDCMQKGACLLVDRGSRAVCACDTSHVGADCSARACLRNCSGVGYCSAALGFTCVCPPGYAGDDCGRRACASTCVEPRGRCAPDGTCHCAAGWLGEHCDRPACPNACSAHGKCTRKGCVCEPGWLGPTCSYQACPQGCNARRGQGTCHAGKCYCAAGYSGPSCNLTCGEGEGEAAAAGVALSVNSSLGGGGIIAGANASALPVLRESSLCSGHGRCAGGLRCECAPGYVGAHCEARACLMGCAGHGLCHDGTCLCALGYGGEDCAHSTAPTATDCSTGCVHLCATRCATATASATTSSSSSDAPTDGESDPMAGPGLSAALGGRCFSRCRQKCVASCKSHSAQRLLWADERRAAPTAAIAGAAAASRTLGLRVPSAAAMPPFGVLSHGELLGNTMPHT